MIGDVKALQSLASHTSDVNSVDFAGNCILVTGSGDKLVRVWEWKSGDGYVEAQFSPLKGHKYGVTSVKVSPQSTMLASSSIDGTTLLWNLRTGARLHAMVQAGGEAVRVCRFSPDSTLLATAGDNGQVCIWDLVRRILIRSFQKHDGAVQSLCFSPDTSWLVTTCTFGVLKLFSTAEITESVSSDDRPITTHDSVDDAHDLGVVCCDISAFQEVTRSEPITKLYRLVTCGNDHYVKLWEITVVQGKCRNQSHTAKINLSRILEKHSSALTCVRFSANGLHIASCSLDKTTVIWEATTGKIVTVISGHSRYVACCAFSRDGNLLATGSNDKSVIVWDLTGNLRVDSELTKGIGSVLSVTDFEKSVRYEQDVMKNAEISGNEVCLIQRLHEHCGAVNSVAFCGNRLIASGAGDKQVRVWSNEAIKVNGRNSKPEETEEEEEDEEEEEEGEEEESGQIDGGMVASGGAGPKGLAKFHGKPFSPLEGHKYSVNHVEFSPCGSMLASCSLDGTTVIWHTENGGRARSTFVNSGYGIRVCRWSPDGTRIATAGDDEKATLWAVHTMEELRAFEKHSDAVNAVAFTHDSRYLVTACNEGTWRLFDTHDEKTCAAILVCEEAHDLGVQSCDFCPTSSSTIMGRGTALDANKQAYLLATGGNDSLVKLWRITVCNGSSDGGEPSEDSNASRSGDVGCKVKRSLSGHGGNVTCVRFSPLHGEILGSVATDRTARIWSVFTATCLYVLEDHESLVTACAFSEDASLFVTGSLDKTVLVWKLPQQLVSQSVLIDNLRHNRKSVADWKVDDTLRWLNEIGLSSLMQNAHTARLTGRQLLSLSSEELAGKLRLGEQEETEETLRQQLYWLKCENACSTEVLDETKIPHEFLCPITHELMKEPVKCADGFTYERAAITEWFLCGKYTSPMTNECLQDTSFTPNMTLRNEIYTFLYGNGPDC